MIGYDDKGNQFGSPAATSYSKNSRTSADRNEQQKNHEWCVKRMCDMKKSKADNKIRKIVCIVKKIIEKLRKQ